MKKSDINLNWIPDPEKATIDALLVAQIESERPITPAGNLSRNYRLQLIERHVLAYYRWYVSKSQKERNWNAHEDPEWDKLRKDLPEQIIRILTGFFAVEHWVPDFVFKLLKVIRRSQGRAHFHIRWGSEEEKHSDLWENALLFSGKVSPEWLLEYKQSLLEKDWELPFEKAIEMIWYTCVQERATGRNYTAFKALVNNPTIRTHYDPALANACSYIIKDESAHSAFFHELLRLFLYYLPEETLAAGFTVVKHFAMPASSVVPKKPRITDFAKAEEAIYIAGIYSRDIGKNMIDETLKYFGIDDKEAFLQGIKRSRIVPDESGSGMRETIIFNDSIIEDEVPRYFDEEFIASFDLRGLEKPLAKKTQGVIEYEKSIGLYGFDPFDFVLHPHPL